MLTDVICSHEKPFDDSETNCPAGKPPERGISKYLDGVRYGFAPRFTATKAAALPLDDLGKRLLNH
jgi:hypothetical protein